MRDLVHLLRCVGRAVFRNGGKALASLVPFGEAGFEIACDTCAEYRASRDRLPGRLPAPAETPPATLQSPRRTYTLRQFLAAGDAADVHFAQAEAEHPYVLKVSRTTEGNLLLDNERQALVALLTEAGDTTYVKYLPTLAESFLTADDSAKQVNVFLYEEGFYTLEQVHQRHPALDGRHLAWIFKRLLTVLGFCHHHNRLHGAVLPPHVIIHVANHGLQLVGWGQSVEIGQPIEASAPAFEAWYPPELANGQPASAATDLFLAARCLVYLAGGDPLTNQMAATVPVQMRRFLEACLLEGLRMRPDDAWGLIEEFDELLRRLYGPPTFHSLTMS
jgi:hypothetical protein